MKIVSMIKRINPTPCILMAVDGSSTAIAIAIFEQTLDGARLIETSKIKLDKMPMSMKLRIIGKYFPLYFKKYNIEYVFVEQPIYIQNPATSRILSQISGHIIGISLMHCNYVEEVQIANWKSFIGYKNVSKAEKEAWTVKYGKTEANKMAASERKQRTIRIVHDKISNIDHITDNDVCDAIGIGLYALDRVNKGLEDVT